MSEPLSLGQMPDANERSVTDILLDAAEAGVREFGEEVAPAEPEVSPPATTDAPDVSTPSTLAKTTAEALVASATKDAIARFDFWDQTSLVNLNQRPSRPLSPSMVLNLSRLCDPSLPA